MGACALQLLWRPEHQIVPEIWNGWASGVHPGLALHRVPEVPPGC